MLLSCAFMIDDITAENVESFKKNEAQNQELFVNYILNGGDVTFDALGKLPKETRNDIFDYLRDCPLYEAETIGDKDFLLVHGGLDNFSKKRKISDYSVDDLIWAWPEITDEYYDDIHTVFGHTPTFGYGEEYRGIIIKTRTWTNIDCGAAYGIEPILLRLDDYKEFKLD